MPTSQILGFGLFSYIFSNKWLLIHSFITMPKIIMRTEAIVVDTELKHFEKRALLCAVYIFTDEKGKCSGMRRCGVWCSVLAGKLFSCDVPFSLFLRGFVRTYTSNSPLIKSHPYPSAMCVWSRWNMTFSQSQRAHRKSTNTGVWPTFFSDSALISLPKIYFCRQASLTYMLFCLISLMTLDVGEECFPSLAYID